MLVKKFKCINKSSKQYCFKKRNFTLYFCMGCKSLETGLFCNAVHSSKKAEVADISWTVLKHLKRWIVFRGKRFGSAEMYAICTGLHKKPVKKAIARMGKK